MGAWFGSFHSLCMHPWVLRRGWRGNCLSLSLEATKLRHSLQLLRVDPGLAERGWDGCESDSTSLCNACQLPNVHGAEALSADCLDQLISSPSLRVKSQLGAFNPLSTWDIHWNPPVPREWGSPKLSSCSCGSGQASPSPFQFPSPFPPLATASPLSQ